MGISVLTMEVQAWTMEVHNQAIALNSLMDELLLRHQQEIF